MCMAGLEWVELELEQHGEHFQHLVVLIAGVSSNVGCGGCRFVYVCFIMHFSVLTVTHLLFLELVYLIFRNFLSVVVS